MPHLVRRLLIVPWVVIIVLYIGACMRVNPTHTPTTTTRLLTSYLTITPSRAPLIPTLVLKTPTLKATITPTPITYTVVKGDTMLGIAIRFGVTLEELMVANPQVNPRILSIDTFWSFLLGKAVLPFQLHQFPYQSQ